MISFLARSDSFCEGGQNPFLLFGKKNPRVVASKAGRQAEAGVFRIGAFEEAGWEARLGRYITTYLCNWIIFTVSTPAVSHSRGVKRWMDFWPWTKGMAFLLEFRPELFARRIGGMLSGLASESDSGPRG